MIIRPEQRFHMRLPGSVVPEVWILSGRSEPCKHLPNLLVQEKVGVLPGIGVLPLKLLGPRHRLKCSRRGMDHLPCPFLPISCFIEGVLSSGQPLRIIEVRVVRRVTPFLPKHVMLKGVWC